jgi:HNH endonuclease
VCHRYRGTQIEIHHIQPRSAGGSDDFENAIALCLDCHLWAGHYFANHPKGMKYSPSELQEAKKKWHAIVAQGPLPNNDTPPSLDARYLVSRDYQCSAAILGGDLAQTPNPNSLLASNTFANSILSLIKKSEGIVGRFEGDSFESMSEFLRSRSDAHLISSGEPGVPYFSAIRPCSDQEFDSRVASKDRFNAHLRRIGATASELCTIVAEENECGTYCVQESYLTRTPWIAFLELTNVSSARIQLHSVEGLANLSIGLHQFDLANQATTIRLPRCTIEPGSSVLIPLALLLSPVGEYGEIQIDVKHLSEFAPSESLVVLNLTCQSSQVSKETVSLGPSFKPVRVFIDGPDFPTIHYIHPLDLTSIYTIDRVWFCGSCPHLFLIDENGAIGYWGEALATGQNKTVTHTLTLPSNTNVAILTELEAEITFIESIFLDGKLVSEKKVLNCGDILKIPLNGARKLSITGYYKPAADSLDTSHASIFRNRLIANFIYENQQTWQCLERH